MKKKYYTNKDITVVWDAAKCTHSGNCARGLSSVFKPRERPWIKIDAASSQDIMKTIDTCPSKALSYYKNDT